MSKPVITDHYELGEMLGEGGYGTVHVATRKRHGAGKTAASVTIPSGAPPKTARRPGRGDLRGDLSESQFGEEGESGVHVAIKKVGRVPSDVVVYVQARWPLNLHDGLRKIDRLERGHQFLSYQIHLLILCLARPIRLLISHDHFENIFLNPCTI